MYRFVLHLLHCFSDNDSDGKEKKNCCYQLVIHSGLVLESPADLDNIPLIRRCLGSLKLITSHFPQKSRQCVAI